MHKITIILYKITIIWLSSDRLLTIIVHKITIILYIYIIHEFHEATGYTIIYIAFTNTIIYYI
jgi:hypothetical protein